MNLQLQIRGAEGIAIIDLNGPLVLGPGLVAFNETVSECIRNGQASVVLNLKKVNMMDSSGLGALIGAHGTTKSAGGAVKLLNVSERQIQLLVLTRLSTEFEMFNDEQAAIDSFFPERKRTPFDILEFVQSHGTDQEPAMDGDGRAKTPEDR